MAGILYKFVTSSYDGKRFPVYNAMVFNSEMALYKTEFKLKQNLEERIEDGAFVYYKDDSPIWMIVISNPIPKKFLHKLDRFF